MLSAMVTLALASTPPNDPPVTWRSSILPVLRLMMTAQKLALSVAAKTMPARAVEEPVGKVIFTPVLTMSRSGSANRRALPLVSVSTLTWLEEMLQVPFSAVQMSLSEVVKSSLMMVWAPAGLS